MFALTRATRVRVPCQHTSHRASSRRSLLSAIRAEDRSALGGRSDEAPVFARLAPPRDALDAFNARCAGELWLAPLTKGGNLPFRRLVAEEFGAKVTVSEDRSLTLVPWSVLGALPAMLHMVRQKQGWRD